MIERLNIEKIANTVKEQLNPLYKALGVEKIDNTKESLLLQGDFAKDV